MKTAPKQPSSDLIICGMWGTSSLTLSLVNPESRRILETRSGPGVSKLCQTRIEKEFFQICGSWFSEYGVKDAYLGGMVGSTLGWWEVPYSECPIYLPDISNYASSKTISGVRVTIAPGLKCKNYLDEPDVMRGEEIEALAWLRMRRKSQEARTIICIPGTHTKWIEIVDDKVTRFQTSVVGELFDVLTSNGVLAQRKQNPMHLSERSFLSGVRHAASYPSACLQSLMSVRSRSLLSGQSDEEAIDRLSGLLIGFDAKNTLYLAGLHEGKMNVPVIGNEILAERYALALLHLGFVPIPINSVSAGVDGLLDLALAIREKR